VQNPGTRLQLLLQNVAFLPQFREAMAGRGAVGDASMLALMQPAEPGTPHSLEDIFAAVSGRPADAARHVWQNLEARGGDASALITAARRLIFLKGTDSHDYKFSSAALEDYYKVSPQFRNGFLASSVYHLRGAGDADNKLIDRVRSALAG
jgi:hypothetical protein